MIQWFLAGLALGVIRERAYQSYDMKLGAAKAAKHIAKGFFTEPAILINAIRRAKSENRAREEEYNLDLATGELTTIRGAVASNHRQGFLFSLED